MKYKYTLDKYNSGYKTNDKVVNSRMSLALSKLPKKLIDKEGSWDYTLRRLTEISRRK